MVSDRDTSRLIRQVLNLLPEELEQHAISRDTTGCRRVGLEPRYVRH